jgi:hypothetical protein
MAAMSNIKVKWIDRLREPAMPPNPDYPDGIDIDTTMGRGKSCKVDLPYPAKRCGYYVVKCATCGFTTLITTAGRPDDPRSVRLPCKGPQH